MNLFHWDKLNRWWNQIQQTWKCLYVTTGGLSVVVFNIAFVQEVKVPTSLLSAATTVLSRSHFRNENYVLIHFQYNEFNWKSMSFQALSTVALVRSHLVQQSFRWHFKASVDISCMNFMSIWIIVGECYYWIIEFYSVNWISTIMCSEHFKLTNHLMCQVILSQNLDFCLCPRRLCGRASSDLLFTSKFENFFTRERRWTSSWKTLLRTCEEQDEQEQGRSSPKPIPPFQRLVC